MDIREAGRRLRLLRGIAWLFFFLEVVVVAAFVRVVFEKPGAWIPLLRTMAFILLFWHVLPLVLARFATRKKHQVRGEGDRWRIGKYSERDIRQLADEATAGLPARLRNPRIIIADRRGTGGWTWMSLLWPGWHRRKTIWITDGALHYLEPDELKAVILHEAAHHARENRCDIPGGWLLGDVALLCAIAWGASCVDLDRVEVLLAFFLVRGLLLRRLVPIHLRASRTIEHLCDMYAAGRIGEEAMANVLLKTGEEGELVEAVMVRAAKKLLHTKNVDPGDLACAFEDVRPHGRIFHWNLLRHASEVVRKVRGPAPEKPGTAANPLLEQFLEHRKSGRPRRVLWRRFDDNADGRLTRDEFTALCRALHDQPDRVLFISESERKPTTHPSFRDRVLLLGREAAVRESELHGNGKGA